MSINIHDAMQANLGFVERNLAHIEPGVYTYKYRDIDYANLIPVDFSAPPFTKTVTYYSMDGVGRAGWINGNAMDIPVVGLTFEQTETTVYTAAVGYQYGWEEVNQAAQAGISLTNEKAMLARRAYETFVYNVAFTGDTAKGFEGLFSYTGVTAAAVASDGTGSSPLWSAKTGDLIARDVNALLLGVATGSNFVEMADTLILPVERIGALAATRMDANGSDINVMAYIRQNNVYTQTTGQPLTIIGKLGLLTAGAGSTARMIAYRRSPEVLKLHVPMRHRFLEVQLAILQYKVPGVFRLGGLDIRLKKAVRYADGI